MREGENKTRAHILQVCGGDGEAALLTVMHAGPTVMHAGSKLYIDGHKWSELGARTADILAALDRTFDTTNEVEKRKRDDFAQAIRKVRVKWLTREGNQWVLLRAVNMAEKADVAGLGPFANMDKTGSDEEIRKKIREAHEEADLRAENQACASAANAMDKRAANLVEKMRLDDTESTDERAEDSNSELDKLAEEWANLQQKVDDQEKVIQERDATIEKLEADIEKLQDMFEKLRKSKKEVEHKLLQAWIDIAGHQEEIEELKREKNAGKAVGLPEV